MRSLFDVSSSRVGCGFSDSLTNRRLHFIWIGLGQYFVKIQVQCGLIDTVEILKVSECDQSAVSKTICLIRGKLRRCAARDERHTCASRERQPRMSEQGFHGTSPKQD